MSWVLLVIFAVNMFAAANIFDKHIITKRVKDPLIALAVQGIPITLLALAVSAAAGISVPAPPYLLLSFLAAMFMFGAAFIYYNAMKLEEASRVVPLFGTIPLFTLMLASLFLGEAFAAEKYVGIALLVAGALLISSDFRNRKLSKGFFLMLGASFLFALSYVAMKYLSSAADVLSAFVFIELSLGSVSLLLLLSRRNEVKRIYARSRKTVLLISLPAALAFFAFMAMFTAISQGPVSLVVALGNTQYFFVLLYATLISVFRPSILKEQIGRSVIALKLLAIAVIFAGAYLISV